MYYLYLLLFVSVFELVSCARSSTCSPSAFYNCIDQEFSKYSCDFFLSNSSSVGASAGHICLNKVSGSLSADKQETCKETLRNDLQKNLNSRVKQMVDSIVKQCVK